MSLSTTAGIKTCSALVAFLMTVPKSLDGASQPLTPGMIILTLHGLRARVWGRLRSATGGGCKLVSWNHGMLCVRRTFRGHLAQTPCSEQGHLPLDQVAQSPVQPGLE